MKLIIVVKNLLNQNNHPNKKIQFLKVKKNQHNKNNHNKY